MRISDWSSDVCSSDLRGQHFFFDIGNGDSLAFFWFPDAPEAVPGISAPAALPTKGSFVSAHGSMNHIAINVRADKFDDRSEEHTSEPQSLITNSYAVLCLTKKQQPRQSTTNHH